MSWTVTPQLKTLAGTAGAIPQASILGLPIDGGFFGGYISHTANSVPTHALIVAPAAIGATGAGYTLTTNLFWKTTQTLTAGTDSDFDGAANTAAMVTAGIGDHPAAEFCVSLNIDGFTDWYLPARLEMDIAYFNLKPNTVANSTSWGVNAYSVPARTVDYTSVDPAQSPIVLFQENQVEAFGASGHWLSTQASASSAWRLFFDDGRRTSASKASGLRLRAFRRVAL